MDYALIGGGVVAGGLMLNFIRNAIKEPAGTHEPEHNNVHGTASIASTLAEVETAGLTSRKPGGFFIAAVVAAKERHARLLRFQQDTGCLVFGGPGTGKGTGFVVPTILDRDKDTPESLLVYDPAAQLISVTGRYLQSIGTRVVYSNVAGILGQALRDKFGPPVRMNPLGSVDINDPLAEVEIAETAAVLVPLKDSDKSPHFAGTAQQLCAAVAIWLLETEGEKATWVKVGESIHYGPSDMNLMFALMKKSRFAKVRATAQLWYLEIDDKGNMKSATPGAADCLTTARRELNFLLTGAISEMFSAQEFDFAIMKKTRTAFFFVMPDSENSDMKKCSYLVLRTAKRAQMTPGGLNVLWLLDEMCAALPSSGAALVRDAAALVRKYGIRIAGICQSWAQFENWCGGAVEADALRSMFGAAIFYGANDETSVKKIMAEAGRYTVWTPGTNPLHEAGIEGNTGSMGVPLFQPEDIRAMIAEKTQIVSLIGSRKICLLPRSSYLAIKELQGRAAVDPYHLN